MRFGHYRFPNGTSTKVAIKDTARLYMSSRFIFPHLFDHSLILIFMLHFREIELQSCPIRFVLPLNHGLCLFFLIQTKTATQTSIQDHIFLNRPKDGKNASPSRSQAGNDVIMISLGLAIFENRRKCALQTTQSPKIHFWSISV